LKERGEEKESEKGEEKRLTRCFCAAVVSRSKRGKNVASLPLFPEGSLTELFLSPSLSPCGLGRAVLCSRERKKKERERKPKTGAKPHSKQIRTTPLPPQKKNPSYDKGGVPSVTLLAQVHSYSAASGVLERGDIVFAVNGTLLRDDTALFSLAADRAVATGPGATLPVTVFRRGERLELAVPVRDANAEKITRFARFAGGVLHDLKGLPRWKYGGGGGWDAGNTSVNNGTGLFLSYAAPGSSWSALASSSGADQAADPERQRARHAGRRARRVHPRRQGDPRRRRGLRGREEPARGVAAGRGREQGRVQHALRPARGLRVGREEQGVEAGQGLRKKEGGEARKAFEEEETSQPFFLSFFDLSECATTAAGQRGVSPLFFLLSLFSFPVTIPLSSCRE
jgi:hypothetical protein